MIHRSPACAAHLNVFFRPCKTGNIFRFIGRHPCRVNRIHIFRNTVPALNFRYRNFYCKRRLILKRISVIFLLIEQIGYIKRFLRLRRLLRQSRETVSAPCHTCRPNPLVKYYVRRCHYFYIKQGICPVAAVYFLVHIFRIYTAFTQSVFASDGFPVPMFHKRRRNKG